MKLFNYDGAFMRFFLILSRITIVNLLWMLCCIPIVTVGASTAAQHYSAKQLMNGDSHVFQNFKIGFKSYWKKSTIIWLIFAVLAFIFVQDYILITNNVFPAETVITVISVLAFITLLFTMLWIYPVMINFTGNLREIFFNAFIFSFMYVPLTLITVVFYALAIVLFLKFYLVSGLLFLFGPTLVVYASLNLYDKAFAKYRPQEEH